MQRYETQPASPFFGLTKSIVETEIKAGNMVSLISEVDLTEVEQIRSDLGSQRPSYTAFVLKALALALREFPYANRRLYQRFPWGRLRFQQFKACDIAVACERNMKGVEVATFIDILRDSDDLSIQKLDQWLRNLAASDEASNKQWRDYQWIVKHLPLWLNKLLLKLPIYSPDMWAKYRGGSALVSSPAKYGVDLMNGSWTATLGVSFGYVKPRPVVINGKVVARTTFNLLLNFDRRVMAGAPAARFFKFMMDVLTNAQKRMAPFIDRTPNALPSDPIATRKPSTSRLPAPAKVINKVAMAGSLNH